MAKVKVMLADGKQISAKRCDNILSWTTGLMCQKGKNALLSYPHDVRYSIHTFFCQPLQLIFLDEAHRVVEVKHLQSWQTYRPLMRYRHLLELCNPTRTKKGDKIRWQ